MDKRWKKRGKGVETFGEQADLLMKRYRTPTMEIQQTKEVFL